MNLEIEGIEKLNAKLNQLSKIAKDTAREEIADIALDLAGKSSDAAPVQYGDLRGELALPKQESDMSWKVGASLPYTRYQHEGQGFQHPKGGGPKFLEKPFRENVNKYIKEIGKAIESELK